MKEELDVVWLRKTIGLLVVIEFKWYVGQECEMKSIHGTISSYICHTGYIHELYVEKVVLNRRWLHLGSEKV